MKKLVNVVVVLGLCVMFSPVQAELTTVSDDFSVAHDYLASGTAGTIWDGVVNAGSATTMDTTSTPGELTMAATQGARWGWGVWSAPMLYIDVAGDFEATVTVNDSLMGINWWKASLMARVADPMANGVAGEDFVLISLISPEDYDRTWGSNWINGSEYVPSVPPPSGRAWGEGTYWEPFKKMKMIRTGNSFQMYIADRADIPSNEDPDWTDYGREPMVREDLDGLAVQIGISFETGDGAVSFAHFDDFSLKYTPTATCNPGDANGDLLVSADDYAAVQSNFGNTGAVGVPGDANCDGLVSADDYASVQSNFGTTYGGASVPEPATIGLLGIGLIALIRRRK